MESTTILSLLIGAWAIVFTMATTLLFVATKISFRYWMGWLVLALAQLVMSVLIFVLPDDTLILGTSLEGVAVAAFAAISLAVSVQLSISISGHQRMLLCLAQECAELRLRIDQLEAAADLARPDGSAADEPRAGEELSAGERSVSEAS